MRWQLAFHPRAAPALTTDNTPFRGSLRATASYTPAGASLVATLLVVVASISVLHFEAAPEANIKTAEDALWWAFATITTAGYGDRFPVTSDGRFVATILMSAGVALLGTFSAFLPPWFLESGVAEQKSDVAELKEEIAGLRKLLEEMHSVVTSRAV